MTSGIEPATFRLLTECLNELLYACPEEYERIYPKGNRIQQSCSVNLPCTSYESFSTKAAVPVGHFVPIFSSRLGEFRCTPQYLQKCIGRTVDFGRCLCCAVVRRKSASLRFVTMRSDTVLPQ
jgi:hypothetical protein